jgi:Protein of unknown function (DUF1501)
MKPKNDLVSRRELLQASGLGLGSLALACLLHDEDLLGVEAHREAKQTRRQPIDFKPRQGQFPAHAKAVIQLFQNGGPSQMDLFDPKPELTKRSGQAAPEEVETFQLNNKNVLMASPFQFHRRGQSGMELSEVIPHIGSMADEICLVRSMFTEHNNHPQGINMIQTGSIFPGRPSMGSWISYGLGSENQNLPGYVVLRDPEGYSIGGRKVWSSGWLPALYQGTEFNMTGSAVHHLGPAEDLPVGVRQESLALLSKLNAEHLRAHPRESELEARIKNYEMAARMQLEAIRVLDLSNESQATRKLYGLDNTSTMSTIFGRLSPAGFGARCLMARRLVEAGVRFVQVFVGPSQPWDNHDDIKGGLERICAVTDRATAALIEDLKSRGLLDSTIVMWTGEFGRLPITEASSGRDHNRHACSLFFAGGGFKPGYVYGATDEFGYKAVENRVSVPDLHATILSLLGLDHRHLSFLHHGREETLTDAAITGAKVVGDLLKSPPRV